MIYTSEGFDTWNRPSEFIECLKRVKDEDWITPGEALNILLSHGAVTPMADHRAFLAWKCQMGSLASISFEVHETSGDSAILYSNVPLTTEWSLPEWSSEHASLWITGCMRMTRYYAGEKQARDYLEIGFERNEVEILAQLYGSVEPDSIRTEGSGRWTQDQMEEAIRQCKYSVREEAWKLYFKPMQHLHGWKSTSFRERWAPARGTVGRKGAPPKITRG